MNEQTKSMTPDRADYMARCFVNGMRLHGQSKKMEPASGEFGPKFENHPWCREATMEGWARELRSHLILTVRRRIMNRESYDVIDDLMPPRAWIDQAKQDAVRYGAAAKWQKENMPHPVNLIALLDQIAKRANIKFNPNTGEIG